VWSLAFEAVTGSELVIADQLRYHPLE